MKQARGNPLVGSLLALLLGGCAASEDEIRAEFAAYVAGANQCTAVSECAVASTECPLGCGHAVRADRKADVEKKARDLIARYERGGISCAYSCIPLGPLACVAGRCAFAAPSPDAATP